MQSRFPFLVANQSDPPSSTLLNNGGRSVCLLGNRFDEPPAALLIQKKGTRN